jgi:hypothetical protein
MFRAQSFIDFFGEDNGVADNWIGDLLELVTAIEAIKAEHPKLDIKKLKRKCVDESGKVGPDIKFI